MELLILDNEINENDINEFLDENLKYKMDDIYILTLPNKYKQKAIFINYESDIYSSENFLSEIKKHVYQNSDILSNLLVEKLTAILNIAQINNWMIDKNNLVKWLSAFIDIKRYFNHEEISTLNIKNLKNEILKIINQE